MLEFVKDHSLKVLIEYKHWQWQHSPLIYKQHIVNYLFENQETGQKTSDTHAIKPQTHNPVLLKLITSNPLSILHTSTNLKTQP
jgi:hypothetical protein